MRILALETSTPAGAVALLADGRVLAEWRQGVAVTHGERLLAAVDTLLREARCPLEAVEAIAVALGPGSFTGLRIGVSTAKSLAHALGRPLVGVPTLAALAWTVPFAAHPVCPVLDARKGEVYTALFRTDDGQLCRLAPDRAVAPGTLANELRRDREGPVLFVGDGVTAFASLFEEVLGGRARFGPAATRLPSAVTVAELGLWALARGERDDPAALTPLYVRPSEAELMRERHEHAGHRR